MVEVFPLFFWHAVAQTNNQFIQKNNQQKLKTEYNSSSYYYYYSHHFPCLFNIPKQNLLWMELKNCSSHESQKQNYYQNWWTVLSAVLNKVKNVIMAGFTANKKNIIQGPCLVIKSHVPETMKGYLQLLISGCFTWPCSVEVTEN